MNKFVVTIKSNGRILREVGDTVYLPFGSEYSIYMKNLESRKAVVDVTIDGIDVLNGHSLVVDANNTFTLEGFLDGNTLRVRNKFKFIEKTQQISDYRGDNIEDGLVVVKYRFEKTREYVIDSYTYINPYNHIVYSDCGTDCSRKMYSTQSCIDTNLCSNINDSGITVAGSESNQSFGTTTTGILEDTEHTIVLNLKGEVKGQQVCKPITTKMKVQCCTCGRKNKTNMKYCSNCGTALF
jgi:hypothetical protein